MLFSQRDDLERLLKRVHLMQEKIYLAAELSVCFDGAAAIAPQVSMPQSVEGSPQPGNDLF